MKQNDAVAMHYAQRNFCYLFTMESSARMQAATWATLECESSAGAAPIRDWLPCAESGARSGCQRESQIGLPIVAFGNLQLFVSNRDCCFQFVVTCKREVIDRVKTFRLAFLKNEVQASQEGANGPLAGEAVRHTLGLFLGKAPRYELFRVRIGNNIDCLWLVL